MGEVPVKARRRGFEPKAIATASRHKTLLPFPPSSARRLQTASSGCKLSSAAMASRSSETGHGLQATFSKRLFFLRLSQIGFGPIGASEHFLSVMPWWPLRHLPGFVN
jgi:hypothetical protein